MQYVFSIECTKSRFVTSIFCTLSRFIMLIFYAFFNITLQVYFNIIKIQNKKRCQNILYYQTNQNTLSFFQKKTIKISKSKYIFLFFQIQNYKIFLIFILLYWGNFISRALPLYVFHLIFQNFSIPSGDFRFRALYPLSRTTVLFRKERPFLQPTKVSYSTTLKRIFIHCVNIHTFPTHFQFCK